MFWWIVFVGGGIAGSIVLTALFSRAWGRGAHEGMSENMETEGIRAQQQNVSRF
ncbi:MAG: hypothetical protein ACOC9Y_07990 [Chloroflexota bacterium]